MPRDSTTNHRRLAGDAALYPGARTPELINVLDISSAKPITLAVLATDGVAQASAAAIKMPTQNKMLLHVSRPPPADHQGFRSGKGRTIIEANLTEVGFAADTSKP